MVARRYDEIPNIGAIMGPTANHETKPFMNGFGGYNQVKMWIEGIKKPRFGDLYSLVNLVQIIIQSPFIFPDPTVIMIKTLNFFLILYRNKVLNFVVDKIRRMNLIKVKLASCITKLK